MRYFSGSPKTSPSAPSDAAQPRVPLRRRAALGRIAWAAGATGAAACFPPDALSVTRPAAAPAAGDFGRAALPPPGEADVLELAPPPAVPVAAPPPPRVPVFYRPEYTLAGHSFETTRKAAWVAESLATESPAALELVEPDLLTEPDVAAVHDPAYVAAVRTGLPRPLAQSQGFAWDPALWQMVLASNGGAVAAAAAALRTGVAGSLSSGLHHARRSRGNGFCTFNGLAIAARVLLGAGARRVLILDLDAHCGGGTHELVGRDPAVHHVDVSVSAFDAYSPAAPNTLDVVQSAARYLGTIERRLGALDATAFDICLYNAGMDPYQGCPIGGLAGIDRDVLAAREHLVFEWCRTNQLPVAFVLAGGYLGPALDRVGLAALHRLTLAAAAQIPVRAPLV